MKCRTEVKTKTVTKTKAKTTSAAAVTMAALMIVAGMGNMTGAWGAQCAHLETEYNTTYCPGIAFSAITTPSAGVIDHNNNPARCIFIDSADGEMNFGNYHLVNGNQVTAWTSKATFNNIDKVDGGYYIYLRQNVFAQLNVPAPAATKCTLAPPGVAVPDGYLAWNTVKGLTITPASGDWNTTDLTWSSGSSNNDLVAWTNSTTTPRHALFAGADAVSPAVYTITVPATGAPTVGHIRFDNSGYVISGTGTITRSGANSVHVASGKTATINAVIAGATGATLTKTGSGTLILGGTNTYTGNTTINEGTLVAASSGAFGSGTTLGSVAANAAGAALHLSGGADGIRIRNAVTIHTGTSSAPALVTLAGAGEDTLSGNITLTTTSNNRTVLIDVNAPLRTTGAIVQNNTSARVTLNKMGAGTLTIAGDGGANSSFSLNVSEGTLALERSLLLGRSGTGQLGGVFTMADGTKLRIAKPLSTTTEVVTFSGNGTSVSLSGAIAIELAEGALSAAGTYPLFGITPTLADGTVVTVTGPAGFTYELVGANIVATAEADLCETDPTLPQCCNITLIYGCDDYCTENPTDPQCVADACDANPTYVCPGYCDDNPDDPDCEGPCRGPNFVFGCDGYCNSYPTDPECIVSYTVTFYTWDGTEIISVPADKGKAFPAASIPTPPERGEDWAFDFWEWEPALPADGLINSNHSVTARYQELSDVENLVKVDSVRLNAGSRWVFDVFVSGLDAVRDAQEDTPAPQSVWVWYKAGSGTFVAGDETLPSGGRQVVTLPATGDSRMIEIQIDSATKAPADPYFYFNANMYWKAGADSTLAPFKPSDSKGIFALREPVRIIKPNTLTVSSDLGSAVEASEADRSAEIKLTIGGLASIEPFTKVDYRPYADSVGIWVGVGGAPLYPATGADAPIKVAAGTASVTYTYTLGADLLYEDIHFLVAPIWKVGSGASVTDSIPPPVTAGGGHNCVVSVLGPGANVPNNPIALTAYQGSLVSGEDSRKDTVVIKLNKIEGEEFSEGTGDITVEISRAPAFTAVQSWTKRFKTTDFDEAVGEAARTYTLTNPEGIFVGENDLLFYRIIVEFDNPAFTGNFPRTKSGSFRIGRDRPVLSNVVAEPVFNQVQLKWDPVTDTLNRYGGVGSLDSSRIYVWHSTSPIAAGAAVPATGVDTISARTSGHMTLPLEPETPYWFAVVLEDVVPSNPARPAERRAWWNLKSDPVIVEVTTGEETDAPNKVTIDPQPASAMYMASKDSLFFRVIFQYTLEPDVAQSVSYEIHRGTIGALGALEASGVLIRDGKKHLQYDTLRIGADQLESGIKFGTDYVISVFSTGCNSSLKSRAGVNTMAFAAQKVEASSYTDDILINNDSLLLQLPEVSGGEDNPVEVLVVRDDAHGNPFTSEDFLPVSPGYRYERVVSPGGYEGVYGRFAIGIMPNADSLSRAAAQGYSLSDVRLYRCFSSSEDGGVSYRWEVDFDSDCSDLATTGYCHGTALSNVVTDTRDKVTYRLMINTRAPTIALGDNTPLEPAGATYRTARRADTIAAGLTSYREVFKLSGLNVSNTRATLYYRSARSNLMASGMTAVTDNNVLGKERTLWGNSGVEIPLGDLGRNDAVNAGMFVFLVVDNGSRKDTINVSRRVASSGSYSGFTHGDAGDAGDGEWRPFATQVDFRNRSIRPIIQASLFTGEDDEFGQDVTRYRLFRWYRTPDNMYETGNQWVEYEPTVNDDDFSLQTGRLMWLKTAKSTDRFEFVHSADQSVSVSLIDTFTLVLPANQWTDFVLPFRFDISLRDVIAATGDSLDYYTWDTTRVGGKINYAASPIFLYGISSDDTDRILEGGRKPFSIYNNSSVDRVLRVYPRPLFIDSLPFAPPPAASLKGRGGSGVWYYTIRASTENSPKLPGVMIGYSETARDLPVAPAFNTQSVSIVSGEHTLGHVFTSALSRGGRTFRLRFTNGEKHKAEFTWSAEADGDVPEHMQVMFVNAVTGEVLGSGGSQFSVTVDGKSHEDVLMVVGSRDYLNKTRIGPAGVKFALARIAVNQAARSARIKFYIPFAGVDRVEVSVYNMKGVRLWKRADKVRPASWNMIEWKSRESRGGRVAAGLYIVRVRAIDARGKTVAVENRRFTFAR